MEAFENGQLEKQHETLDQRRRVEAGKLTTNQKH